MNVRPLNPCIGAEITDIDLKDTSSSEMEAVEAAFAEHLVLVFRDQTLSPAELLDLTNRFGGPSETPYLTGMPDYPDVVPVIKEAAELSEHTFGAGWHTDFTFQEQPPSRTLLYAIDMPSTGDDTLYCNLYRAFEALTPAMQNSLSEMNAVHSAVRSYGPKAILKDHMENMTITNDEQTPDLMQHPVIRLHPVTKMPALWVNPTYTINFEDMTEAESTPPCLII